MLWARAGADMLFAYLISTVHAQESPRARILFQLALEFFESTHADMLNVSMSKERALCIP
jgi:hypothetical protein